MIYEAAHKRDAPYKPVLHEEAVMFIPAATVTVRGYFEHYIEKDQRGPSTMGTWEPGSYLNYLDVTRHDYGEDGETRRHAGRLIEVVNENVYSWYLASAAWIMGPNGGTIERVAP